MKNILLGILAIAISGTVVVSLFNGKELKTNQKTLVSDKSSNIIQKQDTNKDSVKTLNSNKTVESKVQAYGCFNGNLVSRTEKSYTFDFDVNGILGDNIEVWLEYEYLGFENPTAFSRSINDEVAIGGYVGTKNNTWKSHKEKISPESLRSGDNKIRFSLADDLKTRFGIRNVKCYIQPTKTIERSLYVNQPVSYYFSGKYGFINGFIQGKGSEQAELKVNGVKIKRNSNQFEKLIVKPENTDTAWTALIEAVYPDGETLTTTVNFTKPVNPDFFIPELGTSLRNEKVFTSEMPINLRVGNAAITGESGSVVNNTNISITTLRKIDMPELASGMVNVTSGANGYRFLPHGTIFSKTMQVEIGYDASLLPAGYSKEDIVTYYFDEKTNTWLALEKGTVDTLNSMIVSNTTHFTDFINAIIKVPESPDVNAYTPTSIKELKAADPFATFPFISPPTANNSGTANFSYPLQIPAGRQGMQPNLALQYSSTGGNGWLGLGFDISVPSITVETRWGVPLYSPTLQTESYLVGGEQLLPLVYRAPYQAREIYEAQVEFSPRVEGAFNRIIRHGNLTTNYWWEVIDKNGNKSYYGKSHSSDNVEPTSVLTDDNGNIAHWALTETVDIFGNRVRYYYDIVQDVGISGGTVFGKQIYIREIKYTGNASTEGKYKVVFVRENKDDYKRKDISISARYGFKEVTSDLLRFVDVYYENTRIKRYIFGYQQGKFAKELLSCFGETTKTDIEYKVDEMCRLYGDSNSILLYNFDYFDDLNEGNFSVPHTITATGIDASGKLILNATGNAPTMLGGTTSSNASMRGALTIGIGNPFSKTLSIGGDYGLSWSKSNGMLTMMDINGDGLPDIVFKSGNNLYYKKQFYNSQNNSYQFSDNYNIIGISNFLEENNSSESSGLQASFGMNASFQESYSESYTKTYFSDVNSDGLPDAIINGKIYYNRYNGSGNNILFEPVTGDVVPFTNETCSLSVSQSGSVDDNIMDVPDEYRKVKIERNPVWLDAVKVWYAPYNGTITINAPINLIQDNCEARVVNNNVDGVRYYVQHNGTNILTDVISKDDYNIHDISLTRTVVKGDRIYFRLGANLNRSFDNVNWEKYIKYSATDTTVVDANDLKTYIFDDRKEFLLSGQDITAMPFDGTININGEFSMPQMSDNVKMTITRVRLIGLSFVTTTLVARYIPQGTSALMTIDTTLSVQQNDRIYIKVESETNVRWEKINFYPEIYYESINQSGITISAVDELNNKSVKFNPVVDYKAYPKIIQPSLPYSFSTQENIIPELEFINNLVSGEITFTIKTSNQTLSKRTLYIQNGIVTNMLPAIPITLLNQPIYFEYHTTDTVLANAITTSRVRYGIVNTKNAGVYTNVSVNLNRFGNMYRSWGQFTYNHQGDPDNSINESSLALSNVYNSTVDTARYSVTLGNDDILENISNDYGSSNYNPLNAPFLMMYPKATDKSYKCFGEYTTINRDTTSLSRKQFDSEIFASSIPVYPNEPAPKAIVKTTYSESTSYNIGASVVMVSVGEATTNGKNEMILDYMDLNGDRYPDVVGQVFAQYSKAQGGLGSGLLPHIQEAEISAHKSVSTSTGLSFGASYPVGFKLPSFNSKNSKISIQGNASLSASNGSSIDETKFTWMDINGDGLPDKVIDDGYVYLNLGYKFAAAENWDVYSIRRSTSETGSVSIGFSVWDDSFSGGVGRDGSTNQTSRSLQDVNGDGLIDIVYNYGNQIRVKYNYGAGFSDSEETLVGAPSFSTNSSLNQSLNLSGSYGMTIPIPVCPLKLVINGSGGAGWGVSKDNVQISDLNGDGFPDYIVSNDNNSLTVNYSNIGRTNMLKQANNFAGGFFAIDYDLTQSTFNAPQRTWVMKELIVYDGYEGDGVNYMRMTFEYDSAYYSRYERQSFGFKVVRTNQHYTTNSQEVYRKTIEYYHNDKFLFKGLKYYDENKNSNNQKFIVNTYKYDLKEIWSGNIITPANAQCMGAGFPALSDKTTYFYEGQPTYTKRQRIRYDHGPNGNVIKYYNDGDLDFNTDDFTAEISYHPDTNYLNLISIPKEIIVKDVNNNILQHRKTEINYQTGSIIKIKIYTNPSTFADYLFSYYSNGSLQTVQFPLNLHNQRNSYTYTYDNVVQQYPTNVTDAMGYSSQTTYDYRWGNVLSTTDMAGNSMTYFYDNRGRLIRMKGPNEIQNNSNYAIKHEYWITDNLSYQHGGQFWARTKHFNSDYPTEDIVTVTFADGLGRMIQTKKTSVLTTVTNANNISVSNVMTVSGVAMYDAFGRVVEQYYPITEQLGQDSVLNNHFDNVSPTTFEYDVLDRKILTTLPDNSTEIIEYGFGNDKFDTNRFTTAITDFNGKINYIFTDAKGQQTSIRDANGLFTGFRYNPLGVLTSSVDPEDISTFYFYDMSGKLLRRVHPDAGNTYYEYDLSGNIVNMQTQDLRDRSINGITYDYNYNQLTRVNYPNNPEMNVKYQYGAPNSGNETGRLVYQEDATGIQQFKYGKLGELTENIRTFVLPNNFIYTFKMNWKYDTWNRIKQINYADGEEVVYAYDRAGMLVSMNGVKGNDNYSYLVDQGYDKFGNKNMMKYGNDITTFYEYDPTRRRLSSLYALDEYADTVQSVVYHYDSGDNITAVEKSAERGVNGVPYSVNLTYRYDDLNRLVYSEGSLMHQNDYNFNMLFDYTPSGNINYKRLNSDVLTVNGRISINYANSYTYSTSKPHAVEQINNGDVLFEWTPNGNMKVQDDQNIGNRHIMHWNEENRLTTVKNVNHSLSYYTYDASGERTLKLTGDMEVMNINGQYQVNVYNLSTYSLYTSGYMVINPKLYTKHYYIESDRIVSKIGGGMENLNYNIYDHVYAFDIQNESDYEKKGLSNDTMMYRHIDSVNVSDEVLMSADFKSIGSFIHNNERENDIYYYHKDHIGSSTQISDYRARIIHHIEYMPSGELFAEQRSTWGTSYKFNSKELDAETGLYYYGARYYTPEIGIWLSVDPLSDKYPHQSNYMYCSGRLVNVIDPDGRDEWEVNPTGEVVWKKKSKETTLYSVDKNGKKNGNQVSLKDDKIMQQLSKDKGVVKRQEDAEGKVYKRGKLRSAVSENKEDMAKSFMFLSKNTNSEWSLYSSIENGESSYGLGTYQFDDVSPSSSHVGMKGEVKSMIHSHPLPNSNESEMGSMYGDKNVARNCSYNYFMFAPKSGNLYQINNKSGKISGKGKMSNHKQLMKYF